MDAKYISALRKMMRHLHATSAAKTAAKAAKAAAAAAAAATTVASPVGPSGSAAFGSPDPLQSKKRRKLGAVSSQLTRPAARPVEAEADPLGSRGRPTTYYLLPTSYY
jgi:hypothetical protein